MIQLMAYASANWVTLEAQNPAIDLIRLPFRRLMSILYVDAFRNWGHQQMELRGEGSPPPTFAEFDFLLNAPTDGRPRAEVDGEDEFFGDYGMGS